mmetsp:Transcript_634/g.1492  ORF Transcript_634/g.1492 Transcript_634/m.1492 type:complete len:213 (-) Transcript_634:170-808(-)|eukprot:CAMPEP_0180149302 /NCGR_PEP_ID=MMETSP0986-20121125/20703_1 /TAXON_ID=697907 /ORGANISM="non described non described, Strain CCMP2293" /LENGTH=212 /DNA_ID=CAMNT_0022095881 /DNA_START=202 /DNA_END=840 /DNA_ORIENTATION=-
MTHDSSAECSSGESPGKGALSLALALARRVLLTLDEAEERDGDRERDFMKDFASDLSFCTTRGLLGRLLAGSSSLHATSDGQNKNSSPVTDIDTDRTPRRRAGDTGAMQVPSILCCTRWSQRSRRVAPHPPGGTASRVRRIDARGPRDESTVTNVILSSSTSSESRVSSSSQHSSANSSRRRSPLRGRRPRASGVVTHFASTNVALVGDPAE